MFERLLLAVDDSEAGAIAASFVAALDRDHRTEVRVVHVNTFLVGGRGQTVLSTGDARNLVADTVRQLREHGVRASGVVCRAAPANVAGRLAEVAADWGASAIVLGSQRRRRFARLRGQGIRERVVRASTLPVLVAPAPLEVDTGVELPRLLPPAQPITH